jgi:hypothetical protein
MATKRIFFFSFLFDRDNEDIFEARNIQFCLKINFNRAYNLCMTYFKDVRNYKYDKLATF